MKVLLAGFNIDTDVLTDLMKGAPSRMDVTPETLSASYARISRDPRSIDELRRAAREEVEKSRKSNQAIIFKMGHHSVAEHAVFNFDIIGLSRLAIEELEHFRLCSYTEKSQRYITLDNEFYVPKEIEKGRYEDAFINIVNKQNALYHKLHEKIYGYILKKYPDLAKDPKKQNLLDGWAKEDARYVTCLATKGQLGYTLNARNLELVLRRFAGNKLSEVRELGEQLWKLVEKVAPSIILFYKANDFDEKTYRELVNISKKDGIIKKAKSIEEEVKLVDCTNDADDTLIASILHTSSNAPFTNCLSAAKKMSGIRKLEILKSSFEKMEFYDSVLREFEYADLTYDMIISASCFAQLKRHRMATITCQEYDPELGITIPESITETGMKKEFADVIKKTEDIYYKIKKDLPDSAPYALTNAHRRRVLFKCNARELYHVSRLREDKHAQWDIRDISAKMSAEAKKVMPLSMLLVGGKDKYHEIYKEVFGFYPKIIPVD